MRLKSIFISEYKNLKNFSLTFENDNFLEVFVGKNGSGKSNLFEVLILIFRHLYEFSKDEVELYFDYKIVYEIDGKEITFEWDAVASQLKINDKDRKTIGQTPLPQNIIVYYSGQNPTVTDFINQYDAIFSDKIKGASITDMRRFIRIGSEYKELLLTLLLIQSDEKESKGILCQQLGISALGPELRLKLRRPNYAMNNEKFDISAADSKSDRYWKAAGITKIFLDALDKCISNASGESFRSEGYLANTDEYILYYDIASINKAFSKYSLLSLFQMFDNLKLLGMLSEISVEMVINNRQANITEFSDGQFQSVYIYATTEIFKQNNCITLLDEPDSYLHPDWQFDFIKQIGVISDDAAKTNHVLMSSHSPATLMSMPMSNINHLHINTDNVSEISSVNKLDIVKSLTGNRVSLNDTESIMNISTFVRNTTQPVLFTEGISDEYILDVAWKKLYPGEIRPFCIHNAFDRGFLRSLFQRDELRQNFPERILFALFDFDDAYDDWKALSKGGVPEVNNPFEGLTTKMKHQYHYAMLLPVPNVSAVKKQVLRPDDQPWGKGHASHLAIELLFFNESLVGIWFEKRASSGGGEIITFIGDKVQFAKEFVPNQPAGVFEIFRPMFQLILSKTNVAIAEPA